MCATLDITMVKISSKLYLNPATHVEVTLCADLAEGNFDHWAVVIDFECDKTLCHGKHLYQTTL
jgi:hypothetical protein